MGPEHIFGYQAISFAFTMATVGQDKKSYISDEPLFLKQFHAI